LDANGEEVDAPEGAPEWKRIYCEEKAADWVFLPGDLTRELWLTCQGILTAHSS